MRVFSTILTALTLAAHLIGGCCWHHAHAADSSAVCHHHHDDGDTNSPDLPSEPCEGACVVILDRKADVESDRISVPAWNTIAVHFELAPSDPIERLFVRQARDQRPPPLRAHLRNCVLLI